MRIRNFLFLFSFLWLQLLGWDIPFLQAACKDSLVAYWNFEGKPHVNPETNLVLFEDYSGSNHHGSAITPTTQPQLSRDVPSIVNFKNNFSLLFDGKDDFIEIPDSDSLSFTGPQANFTIVTWLRVNKFTGSDFIGKYDSSQQEMEYAMRALQTGELDIAIADGRLRQLTLWKTTGAGIELGQWYHVVVTIDIAAQRIQFFRNGEEVSTSSVFGRFPRQLGNFSEPFRLGVIRCSNGNLCGYLDGHLDEVRLYSKVLSVEEIRELYQKGTLTICRER